MTWKGDDEPFDAMVQRKRIARMNRIDTLSPELRELVNVYGFYIVDNFMSAGVTKANRIRHLVEVVLDEFIPTRGSFSKQGVRTEVTDNVRTSE